VPPGGTTPKLPGVAEGISPVYARWFERRIRFSLRDDDQFVQVSQFGKDGFRVENDQYDQSNMTAVVVFPTEEKLVNEVRALGWPDDIVESAEQISVGAKLAMQQLYQEHWADNAVSYTVNVPPGSVSQDELELLLAQYLPFLKGTTLMVDDSRPQAPYTRITQEAYLEYAARTVSDSGDEDCKTGACPVR
jgi:ribonucleoside-triphosphate reductase (thioredoxin)